MASAEPRGAVDRAHDAGRTDRPARARVCMLVLNEFLHDARVTKEAESLVAAGYEVSVVAVYSPGRNRERETHPSGFRIIRARPGLRRRAPVQGSDKPAPALTGPAPALTGPAPAAPVGHARAMLRFAVRAPLWVAGRAVLYWRMYRAASAEGARIYHAHDFNVLAPAWLAARRHGAVLVYDAHEISADREGYRFMGSVVRFWERLIAPRARLMITTTDMRAEHFVETYGVARPMVLQNRPRYRAASGGDALATLLDLPRERPIVLYQGGLQAGRGLRNLLAAAARVPDASFVLLGSGRQSDELRRIVADRKLAHVHMHPAVPLDDLHRLTQSATIGIQVLRNTCLNHYTTDSNKLFEYIMGGLAVVASDFPEIAKVVAEYDVGVTVDPDDPGAIVGALNGLLADPPRLARYRGNALAAAPKLSWEAQEERFVEAYRRLAAPQERL